MLISSFVLLFYQASEARCH